RINTLDFINQSIVPLKITTYFFYEDCLKGTFLPVNKSVTIIKTKSNKGFAAANNVALRHIQNNNANVDFIWLLNNDTVVQHDSLNGLLSFMRKEQSIGLCGSLLMEYNEPNKIQSLGAVYNKFLAIGINLVNENDLNTKCISYPMGASMFLRKEFLQTVGLMNEEFFLYFEEMDWVLRGQNLQWEIATCLASKVWHKGGASINGTTLGKSKLSDFFILRNRILFTKKYFPIYLPTVYFSLLGYFINRLRRKQYDRILYSLKLCVFPSTPIHKILKKAFS
nr:glycosyltransferase family 2 protein [Chitinophagaceae bacterium]